MTHTHPRVLPEQIERNSAAAEEEVMNGRIEATLASEVASHTCPICYELMVPPVRSHIRRSFSHLLAVTALFCCGAFHSPRRCCCTPPVRVSFEHRPSAWLLPMALQHTERSSLAAPQGNGPVLLFPCGHTFCDACLRQHTSKHANPGKAPCPYCRQPIQSKARRVCIPTAWVSAHRVGVGSEFAHSVRQARNVALEQIITSYAARRDRPPEAAASSATFLGGLRGSTARRACTATQALHAQAGGHVVLSIASGRMPLPARTASDLQSGRLRV